MRRRIWALLIGVVILGGLFVAADRIAVSDAESWAADRIQSADGLSDKPDVSIKGFPFLTQVLSGDLDDVQITSNSRRTSSSARNAGSNEPLHITRFTVDLRDIHLDGRFPDFSGATAASVSGTALVPYSDISQLVSGKLSGAVSGVVSDIQIGYGGADSPGHGEVKVAATVRVPLLGSQRLSAVTPISVSSGGKIGISLRDVLSQLVGEETRRLSSGLSLPGAGLSSGLSLPGSGLSSGLSWPGSGLSSGLSLPGAGLSSGLSLPGAGLSSGLSWLITRLPSSLSWPVTGLPTGIQLRSVQPTPDGLQVSLTGAGVPLEQAK